MDHKASSTTWLLDYQIMIDVRIVQLQVCGNTTFTYRILSP